jgi:hypothetical protein
MAGELGSRPWVVDSGPGFGYASYAMGNWTLARINVPPGTCRFSHRPPSPDTNAQDPGHGCLHNSLDFNHGRGAAPDPQHNRTCVYNIEPRLDSARPSAFFVPQHDRDKRWHRRPKMRLQHGRNQRGNYTGHSAPPTDVPGSQETRG